MGLQIWLPLTKDLRQQGLSNVTATNNGATVYNNGKIGKCYYFNGTSTSSGNTIYIPQLTIPNTFSVSGWFKLVASVGNGSAEYLVCLNNNSYSGDMQFAIAHRSKGLFVIVNNIEYTIQSLELDIWYHIALTFNGTYAKVYINGIEVDSRTFTYTAYTGHNFNIGSRSSATNGSTHSYYSKIYVNDVRLYDNALSASEVKLLSQGLILHYPLNRNGWGRDNLITDTNFTSSFISSMAVSNAVNLGQWKRETSNVTLTMDGEYVKLHYETNTSRYGIHYEISLEPGTYTYSITAGGRMTCSFGLATSWPSTNVITANSPGRYSKTFTVSETATYRMYIYTTSANPDIWFNWPKLEVSNKSTPWIPNSADALYTTMDIGGVAEYDISGYQNNGTRNGSFVWADDTPKYSLSTNFTGTQYVLSDSPSINGATLSVWVKTTSTGNQALVIDYKSGLGIGFWSGVIIPSCNSSIKTTYQISNYHANQWNHIVVVKNTSSSILCYVNGELQSTTATNDYWSTGVIDGLSIASRPNGASPATCKISDVRIYVTALSADDIKSLYESNKL